MQAGRCYLRHCLCPVSACTLMYVTLAAQPQEGSAAGSLAVHRPLTASQETGTQLQDS